MEIVDLRISKLREYLFNVITSITQDINYQINADFLGSIDDYSLDKIPTDIEVQKWIIGTSINRDVYSFRSRKAYSQDTINNLKNIGFFEIFESKIKSNNDKGILPNIENIQSIECLNCGTLSSVDGTEAIFDIQIQITYIESKEEIASL